MSSKNTPILLRNSLSRINVNVKPKTKLFPSGFDRYHVLKFAGTKVIIVGLSLGNLEGLISRYRKSDRYYPIIWMVPSHLLLLYARKKYFQTNLWCNIVFT